MARRAHAHPAAATHGGMSARPRKPETQHLQSQAARPRAAAQRLALLVVALTSFLASRHRPQACRGLLTRVAARPPFPVTRIVQHVKDLNVVSESA